jgi:pSer/pThr/pTyr-binding forkhead associated (FHA) protein
MSARVTLTIRNGKMAGKEYEFDARRLCAIGRSADCDVPLVGGADFMAVSRRHCLLELDPPRVRVRDLGSYNGTHLNGMQIGRPKTWDLPPELADAPFRSYAVADGDEIRVGPVVLEVRLHPAECPRQMPEPASARELCTCA